MPEDSFQQNNAYLAFDLGASNGRAVVGRLGEGEMHMEEVYRFETPLIEDDGLFWDVEALWEELQTGLEKAVAAAPEIKSLSVSSWGVDYVPLGADGVPVRPPYSYRDLRTEGLVKEVAQQIPAEEFYQLTGIQPMQINTLYQVLADRKQDPDLFRRTEQRLPIADYFNHRFGGEAVAEVSLASTTQLLQADGRQWATELMERLELDADAWPRLVDSGTQIGSVRERPEIKVIAGLSHDTACAVAATPAVEGRSWAFLSCGTWSLLGQERVEPVLSEEARQAGFTNERGLGGTTRLLQNLTGLWVLQECEREWEEQGFTYDELLSEAETASPVGSGAIDFNDDRFLGRGRMQEKIAKYCMKHDLRVPETRGEVVRAILEGLVRSYRDTIEQLEAITEQPVETLHILGGGSQIELLCQWTADASGSEVVAGPVEATALGNLLVQAYAQDDLPSSTSLREVVRQSSSLKRYQPNGEAHSREENGSAVRSLSQT